MDDYGDEVPCDDCPAIVARLSYRLAAAVEKRKEAERGRDEALALVTEWQTSYQSLSEIRHKLLQERDYWRKMYEAEADALRRTQSIYQQLLSGALGLMGKGE